jgi:hypothetical protein
MCPNAVVTIQLYRREREVKEAKARNIYAAFATPRAARALNLYGTNCAISASTSELSPLKGSLCLAKSLPVTGRTLMRPFSEVNQRHRGPT